MYLSCGHLNFAFFAWYLNSHNGLSTQILSLKTEKCKFSLEMSYLTMHGILTSAILQFASLFYNLIILCICIPRNTRDHVTDKPVDGGKKVFFKLNVSRIY